MSSGPYGPIFEVPEQVENTIPAKSQLLEIQNIPQIQQNQNQPQAEEIQADIPNFNIGGIHLLEYITDCQN